MAETGRRAGLALLAGLCLVPVAAGAEQGSGEAPAKPPPAAAGTLHRAIEERVEADEAARASQKRVEALDDETQKLLSEYRRALADAESHRRYADQLAAQIESQGEEIVSFERQLREVETTSREIAPLMQKMLETLEQFVALDVPFLPEERARRVANLKQTMTRADVTFSEKYRRILEAYQVELEYGRTIEAYEGRLGVGDDARTVQFLRVGRVALLYQTLDGRETGYWDSRRRTWAIDGHYAHAFAEGVGVARKSRAPELLFVPVPVPAPEES
jgi:hypothetical protein